MLLSQVFKYVPTLASKTLFCINFTKQYDLINCQNRFVTIEVSFLTLEFLRFCVFTKKVYLYAVSNIKKGVTYGTDSKSYI